MRFPSGAVSYGTTRQLFSEIAGLFERYIGLSKPEAALAAGWSATTWFSDRMSSPPPLLVSGPDMEQAVTLFRLLSCLCRRPLTLADISRSAIRSLPMFLRPTLLVNQPDLSSKIRAFWRASNYQGLFVPGNGGVVLDIACSKAVYLGLEGMADPWCDTALPTRVVASATRNTSAERARAGGNHQSLPTEIVDVPTTEFPRSE